MTTLQKITLPLAALLLVAGFYTFFHYWPTPQIDFAGAPTQQAAVEASQNTADTPIKLIIPNANINANIIKVGLAADGSIGVPSGPYDVAWYDKSVNPGNQGSAVISGHYGPWKSGAHSVFDHLSDLKVGDKVQVVDSNNATTTFVVYNMHIYNSSDSVPEIFNKTDAAYLNLITCNGDWIASEKTYTKRLVVFTKRVD